MIAFSVPVTDGSSRNMSAPSSRLAEMVNPPFKVTSAPNASNARKWVSILRRPITSPPGGGSSTWPNRASSGPASKSDARIRSASTRSTDFIIMSTAGLRRVVQSLDLDNAWPVCQLTSSNISHCNFDRRLVVIKYVCVNPDLCTLDPRHQWFARCP